MRVALAIMASCLLAACASTPTPPAAPTSNPESPALDARAQVRAHYQHWLSPNLLEAFPAAPESGSTYRPPAHLAVLLPQSGNLAVAGNAIRDGLLAAYYAETRTKPIIRFYDSQATAEGAKAAYQHALKDGAQLIIGPITKDEVAAVVAITPSIPVLALNQIDVPNNPLVLNFSLSPDREAELMAERLLQKKILHIGVFTQNTDNAQRMAATFEKNYTAHGGHIVTRGPASITAVPETLADANALVFFMNGANAKTVRAVLNQNTKNELPILASSDIFDTADSQLDGIEGLQMPWLLSEQNVLAIRPSDLSGLPSAHGAGSRLNAFGLDAWLIATRLGFWLQTPNTAIAGATGQLHLEPDGRIERTLTWVKIQNGVPVANHVDQP